jgi:hypothetical protein
LEGVRFSLGALLFLAGRITNPPWGAPLRSRIRDPAGFTMPAPILKRTRLNPEGQVVENDGVLKIRRQ